MRRFYVYVLADRSQTLYTGVTNDLERRVHEHKTKRLPGFTAKYNISRLVYDEVFAGVRHAIAREKQIKEWLRSKKIAMTNRRTAIGRTWRRNGTPTSWRASDPAGGALSRHAAVAA